MTLARLPPRRASWDRDADVVAGEWHVPAPHVRAVVARGTPVEVGLPLPRGVARARLPEGDTSGASAARTHVSSAHVVSWILEVRGGRRKNSPAEAGRPGKKGGFHAVVLARLLPLANTVHLQHPHRGEVLKLRLDFCPVVQHSLGIALGGRVEEDEEGGGEVFRGHDEVVELPGAHFRPEVVRVVTSAVRVFRIPQVLAVVGAKPSPEVEVGRGWFGGIIRWR
eukprot:CAMPEP_0180303242 /NCGR_PEP_ID=MMETSP0988-20121125/24880_1 /TAXON_ID=697907 /ORGANISM="non described non described, Strain CCMP2293" /LENGTH=223 /DNA_ID=CAMNT_0022284779 /DNA_START=211 /DNA_END=880 /DNA_ORIENTATION=-